MNRKLVILIFASLILFLGCNKTDTPKVTEEVKVESDEEFVKIIREDIISKSKYGEGKENNLIPAIIVDIVKLEKIDNKYNIFTNIIEMGYSFDNGIFANESGGLYPRKYELNENKEIENIIDAKDGAYFSNSILEMADNNKELAEKLMESQGSFNNKYDELMAELKKSAEAEGLENIVHKIEDIPGYEKSLGIKYIEDEKNPKGVISVIKTEDYEKLQEERKSIVPSDQPGTHWVYAPCVLFHEETGICVEGILDYND